MTTSMTVADFIASLQREASSGGVAKGPPPVERWNPPFCGDSFIEILRDGTWRHEGVRMTRESLVRLFASILRKDEDGITYLVTPVEKVSVKVEDAPFLAVRVDREGAGRDQTIAVTTNMGDVAAVGPDHPLRVETTNGEPRPYVLVRGRLEARVLRAPFYELVDWAEEEATPEGPRLGVWSGGAFFPIGPVGAHLQ
ncbi:MAG: DUF1285 domain-containing protein [Hyphomonadaceae bacterium]|nr:MAG: hypothetical protein FD160_3590 [Caulobacteraceae bacterium]MBT9446825.1 DUF1285 domain-containing protein [Hyphomonadaceae bacterium]